ncbi:efflux RND transporter permease subunit [Gemmatimonadota bacterium]
MHISELSIKRPVATTMFYLAVVLIGVISFSRLAVDLFPSLQFPRLVIWTTYTNVSPEEVEQFISEQIESQVMQVPGIREVHSVSREGVSLVTLEFNWDADMEYAMLNVREKLDILRNSLPDLAGRPTILKADPNAEPIMSLAVSGRGGLAEIKGLAENVVKRRLEQIDGVALASVTGGSDRQIRVEVDRETVESLGITLQEIQSALARANAVSMGGNINRGRFQWYLRPVGDFQSIDDIERVVVARRGERLVTVSDVAVVVDGFRERDNFTRFNGAESIGILLQKEAGSNTSQVSSRVHEVLAELEEEYSGLTVAVAFDQADFVNSSISNVIWAIALGGLFAFLILFFFLHDIRNPLNIGMAIPISVIATFSLLYFSGITLNMMSLGGLALGVGLLVDNSIVVLENIFRHRELGEGRFEAASNGAREVAMAVTASTFTTISVFLPIVFIEGVAGQLFRDQALTVTFSLLCSLVVSLTILPMLASRFLHMDSFIKAKEDTDRVLAEAAGAGEGEGSSSPFTEPSRPPGIVKKILLALIWPFRKLFALLWWLLRLLARGVRAAFRSFKQVSIRGLRGISTFTRKATRPIFALFDAAFERFTRFYHEVLELSLDNRGTVVAIAIVLVGVAVWVGIGLDKRLIPEVDQGEFSVDIVLPPGTNLATTASVAGQMEEWLLEMPEVEHVFMNAGLVQSESALGSQDSDINTASIRVRLHKRIDRSTFDVIAELRERGRQLLGAELTFSAGETTFSEILGTSQADLAVKVRGLRLDTLQVLISRVEGYLQDVDGLKDIHVDFAVGKPEIRLTVDHRVIEQFGLSVSNVVNLVKSTIRGEVATDFQDFDRKVEILVREDESREKTLQEILNLGIPVGGQGGGEFRVPLRELVDWTYTTGANEVRRESQNRQITAFASVEGRRLDDAIAEVENLFADMPLPEGYELVVGGVNEEMRRSFRSLFFALLMAVLLVYMILAAQFESPLHPFTIMATVPLAGIGVVLGLKLFGSSINIMSLVGMVMLTGIVVNDGIIKVDFINQLRAKDRPLRKAIVEAGHYRLRPVLMTTVTTMLGLTPMAIGFGAGAELRRPLAIAVIGGEFSATALTLIVIPVVYSLIESLRGNKLGSRAESFDPDAVGAGTEVAL